MILLTESAGLTGSGKQ